MKSNFRLFGAFLLSFILFIHLFAQQSKETDKMAWWRDARFGMFIHWGVSSVPAGSHNGFELQKGFPEWIMLRMQIPMHEYQLYAKQFDPVKFNAEEWVRIAKDAGMKYIVFTTKHHDGFAMFETKASKWNIVDATPYKKDVLKELVSACKNEDIKLGFYYSHA